VTTESLVWPCARVEHVEGFFVALREAICESGDWVLAESQGPLPAVVANYCGREFDGEGLWICAFEGRPGTVDFAPKADIWGLVPANDACVTDEQINEAFFLFAPVARAAARKAGLRLHFRLARPRRFTLPEKLRRRIDAFVALANLDCLHPCDWERFYEAVHHAHKYRVNMRPDDLARELLKRKVPRPVVEELTRLYGFGRSLLARRFTWD